jgi:hypothetical protein
VCCQAGRRLRWWQVDRSRPATTGFVKLKALWASYFALNGLECGVELFNASLKFPVIRSMSVTSLNLSISQRCTGWACWDRTLPVGTAFTNLCSYFGYRQLFEARACIDNATFWFLASGDRYLGALSAETSYNSALILPQKVGISGLTCYCSRSGGNLDDNLIFRTISVMVLLSLPCKIPGIYLEDNA